MTAQELIEVLSDLDPNTEVYVQYPSGDYWGTVLASSIAGGDYGNIKYSDYHNQDQLTDEEDDDTTEVFVLETN